MFNNDTELFRVPILYMITMVSFLCDCIMCKFRTVSRRKINRD